MINKIKSTMGITLISLVVTIIILLILAGITINLVLTEGGLFERATQSAEEHEKAEAREKLELKLADMVIEKNTNKNYNENEWLTEQLEKSGFDVDEGNINLVTVNGWQFEIDRSVPKIAGQTGKVEDDKEEPIREVKPDSELEALLKEANMTITLEDILNTPGIMNEVTGLIPVITEADVTREEIDGVITYTDHTGGIIRTPTEDADYNYRAWKVFDNDVNTALYSAKGSALSYYLEYEFSEEVYAMQIKYIMGNGVSADGTRIFIIQGYDEINQNWVDLTEDLTWTGTHYTKREDIENLNYEKTYKIYRIYIKSATYTSDSGGALYSGLWSMQLYGVTKDATTEEQQKQALLANSNLKEITLNHMVTNKEFTEKLIHALSIETVKNNETLMANLPSLIPVITETDVIKDETAKVITYKDSTGGFIRTASEEGTTGYSTWFAFDNDIDTSCASAANEAVGYYLEYEFKEAVYAIQISYIMTNSSTAEGTRTFVIQGYDEETSTWNDLTNELTWKGTGNTKTEEIEKLKYTKAYKSYRLYVKSATYSSNVNGGKFSGLYSMQLYGKK